MGQITYYHDVVAVCRRKACNIATNKCIGNNPKARHPIHLLHSKYIAGPNTPKRHERPENNAFLHSPLAENGALVLIRRSRASSLALLWPWHLRLAHSCCSCRGAKKLPHCQVGRTEAVLVVYVSNTSKTVVAPAYYNAPLIFRNGYSSRVVCLLLVTTSYYYLHYYLRYYNIYFSVLTF